MTSDPANSGSPDFGVHDEKLLTTVGPSRKRYMVAMQRRSMATMLAKFSGLSQFAESDTSSIDALLARVLGRSFPIAAITEVILSGDGDAKKVFKGLAQIQGDDIVTCRVTRERYTALRPGWKPTA